MQNFKKKKYWAVKATSLVLASSLVFQIGVPNCQVIKAADITGIPYETDGSYNVKKAHVIINQVYGGGNNKGAGSHGFIELYNPTDEDVNLNGWSIQYQGAQVDDKNTPGWNKLDLTGTIPAKSSYLIRTKKYKDDTTPANYQVPEGDQQWDDISINGKGVSVALMSNTTLLTTNDLYDNTTHTPKVEGYVDVVGVTGNDNLATQIAPAYEGYATASQSTKKAVRRIAFQDTDCNAVGEDDGDFVIIEYNAKDSDYLEWAHPRRTADGAWDASDMPEFKETTTLSETAINTLTNCIGSDSATTRTFTWQMPLSVTGGSVNISQNQDLSNAKTVQANVSVNHKQTANVFRASVTDLTENTTYYYQVTSGDARSEVYSFHTPSKNETFTFVHASDSQSKAESGYDIYQQAIANITAQYKPSFILETGDLIDTNYFEDEWRWFIGKSQNMFANTAFFPVVGNHEESSSYAAWAMREHFTVPNDCKDEAVTPGTVYSYDYGNAHFVILNTENKTGLEAQKKWLDEDLAATKQKFTIVAFHRGIYGGNGVATDVKAAFESVIDKHQVDLVLFGHDHSYIRTKALKNGTENADGTIYLQGGGCGEKQDAANAVFPEYAEITATPGAPCYNIITVTDKEIKVDTVTVDLSTNTITSLQENSSIVTAKPDAKIGFTIQAKDAATSETEKTTESTSVAKNTLSLNAGLKVSQTGKKLNVSWGKVKDADGYMVYVQYCGKKFATKATKTIKTGKTDTVTMKKLDGEALKLKKDYKVQVVAYKNEGSKKVVIGKSIIAYVTGEKNSKITNAKAVKLAKSSVALKVGKTEKISASVVSSDKSKKVSSKYTAKFRYATSDKAIATVTKNGRIKALKKGSCTIYVYAHNGYAKKVKVTVK